MKNEIPKGSRRADAWWEPTFNPGLHGSMTLSDWNFANNTGPKKAFLHADYIKKISTEGIVLKLINLTFEQCDLQGYFEHKPNITFNNCRFIECDFSLSEWCRTTFKNCEFTRCSLALSTFDECEFRNCTWNEIGMQGSKTDFIRTFITNPEEFIDSAFSGTDTARASPKHIFEQKTKLERTKAQVTRTILQSHRDVGDDQTFYLSAKLHDLQQVKSSLYEVAFRVRFQNGYLNKIAAMKFIPLIFEYIILTLFGFCNDWGSKLSKPLFLIFASFMIFGFMYPLTEGQYDASFDAERSFNISILAGYGNAINTNDNALTKLTTYTHIVSAIVFYTIFFSTVISRNSRSR